MMDMMDGGKYKFVCDSKHAFICTSTNCLIRIAAYLHCALCVYEILNECSNETITNKTINWRKKNAN